MNYGPNQKRFETLLRAFRSHHCNDTGGCSAVIPCTSWTIPHRIVPEQLNQESTSVITGSPWEITS